MSRFGIRRKLKQSLGLGSSPVEITNRSVTFVLPDGEEVTLQAEDRYTLLMASQSLSSPIDTGKRMGGSCPDGRCGACRVEVLDSTGLSSRGEFEVQVMEEHTQGLPHEGRPRDPAPPHGPATRLACHARIIGDGPRIQVARLVNYEEVQGED